jgi:hypothetical protein
MNNNVIPGDWKKATVVPIYKGGERSAVGNYRPVSLTSVACKQMKYVIAGYLKQVWEMSGWLYEGQHGFRPGYSCESQIVMVCQDNADSLDVGVRTDAIVQGGSNMTGTNCDLFTHKSSRSYLNHLVIDFSKAFDFFPHDRLLTKIAETGWDLRVVLRVKEFLLGRSQRQSRRATF